MSIEPVPGERGRDEKSSESSESDESATSDSRVSSTSSRASSAAPASRFGTGEGPVRSGMMPEDAEGPSAAAPRSPRRWLLPLAAIAFGVLVYSLLVATREQPVTADFVPVSPLVRIQTVSLTDLRMSVSTRGTVLPRTESDLVAEVSGRILSLSPKLVVGGFFEEGDELLRLDDREYRIARDRARATVALRESEARLAESEVARRRQLRKQGASSAADLEQFESRQLVASASLAEARAALQKADLDLERTVLRAPFAGRVRERNVDVGRFVSSGTKLGRIFAVDYAEVRLPVQTDELAFLEGALGRERSRSPSGVRTSGLEGAFVKLTGRLGGRDYHWPARLERAEAAIDEQTRMLHVVARVEDPYGLADDALGEDSDPADSDAVDPPGVVSGASERVRPASLITDTVPLPSGLFVHAEIEGRLVREVAVLPPLALRDGDRVFVFEAENGAGAETATGPEVGRSAREGRLRIREVSVLRRDRDQVILDGGLEEGEEIVVSPLRIFSEGMRLRAVEARDS